MLLLLLLLLALVMLLLLLLLLLLLTITITITSTSNVTTTITIALNYYYGQMAYDTGLSLHDFSETVNSVLDVQRSWRRFFQKLWDVARSYYYIVPWKS